MLLLSYCVKVVGFGRVLILQVLHVPIPLTKECNNSHHLELFRAVMRNFAELRERESGDPIIPKQQDLNHSILI